MTSIPTSLGWEIVQTPHGDQSLNADALTRTHLHLLVLGGDIKAPVGLEWQIARRARRAPILFKADTLHTPAADAFIRELARHASWRTFKDLRDLRAQVSTLLADYLLAHAHAFALNAAELERLNAWKTELSSAPTEDSARRAAGDSGVILSAERYLPSSGTLVK